MFAHAEKDTRPLTQYAQATGYACWLIVGSPLQRLDFTTFNPLADPDFCFYDDTLLESVKVGDDHTHEFFRLLSLCHTVMSEEKSEGE